jgi:16S rRNA (guanine966-N2)-methyltransferase
MSHIPTKTHAHKNRPHPTGYVRITSGVLRGRRIQTPPGDQTRPLLTRIRKSLADILRPRLPGARVLDVFGGSGAIACELLSNGAAQAVVVELDPGAADIIVGNARSLGLEDVLECVRGDALASLREFARQQRMFDIIIIAPPYGRGLQALALEVLGYSGLLSAGGVAVVQREDDEPHVPSSGILECRRTRTYGRTVFDFYE